MHITDNEIADGGHRWRQAVAVLVGKCSYNEISYNHSLIANPRFMNPAKGDFRLRPNSPALKIGFIPFPLVVGQRKAAALSRQ